MQKNNREISILKKRILEYIDFKGISKSTVYQNTKITNGVFSQNNGLSEDSILKFLNFYTDINPNWLLTGEPPMISGEAEVITSKVSEQGIPLIPISAMAGMFTEETSILEHECEHFIIPTFKGADFLINIKGDSMQPKYYPGDIVACKKLPIDTFFQWNKIYVIDTDQGPLIKRIKKSNSEDTILVVSENQEYEPFELNRKHIYNIAIVLGVVRLE